MSQPLDHIVCAGQPEWQAHDCLVLAVFESGTLHGLAPAIDEASGGYLTRALSLAAMSGKRGEYQWLLAAPGLPVERVLLVGCGQARQLDARRFVKIARHAARLIRRCGATHALSDLATLPVSGRRTRWKIKHLVEGTEVEGYRFEYPSKSDSDENDIATNNRADIDSLDTHPGSASKLTTVTWHIASKKDRNHAERACRQSLAIAAGITLARDLGNQPGNVCTPAYLAERAVALAEQYSTLSVTILDEPDMQELGMGALLGVSQGSREPARFIVLDYHAGSPDARPVVLVGKGVTFDSGGLSIKPASGMEDMKFDMCGAASVLGTLKGCAQLALPIRVVGLIPAVENMPGGGAYKPGDVVRSMSGRTIEVLNTDAEGRLALCDALTYARRNFEPAILIDVATLTGACLVALGRHAHGLFSNSRSLTRALTTAGKRAHDRPWPMPLWEDYDSALSSDFANMVNMGGRSAGAITAACFLKRYVGSTRWAHLDVAGTASTSGNHRTATGRPVPLLMQYLIDRVESKDLRSSGVR